MAELRGAFVELDEGRSLVPHALLQRLQGLAGPNFCVRQPNDVHEIYVKLVEWASATPPEGPLTPAALGALDDGARQAWAACMKGTEGALAPDLYGMLRRDVRCGRCDARYANHETFSALVLDLPASGTLPDAIGAHFAERDLNAEGGTWRCDRCGANNAPAAPAWTRATLVHAPTVFTFAINRYGGPGQTRGVAFPEAFDLEVLGGSGEKRRYRCVGAALNTGGHCVAATVRGDGRWAVYDDATVTEVGGPPNGSPHVQLLAYVQEIAH